LGTSSNKVEYFDQLAACIYGCMYVCILVMYIWMNVCMYVMYVCLLNNPNPLYLFAKAVFAIAQPFTGVDSAIRRCIGSL
jgi:hypothetical protein